MRKNVCIMISLFQAQVSINPYITSESNIQVMGIKQTIITINNNKLLIFKQILLVGTLRNV